ncbi:metalloreductase [Stipitochalara longipes BDJ]|nr:metalloreductase [Stipitochalara longipes BDJ]
MAAGVPSLYSMQQMFWAFIGTAIGIATLANIFNRVIYHLRITSRSSIPNAARPKAFFFRAHASMSAIIREYGYYSLPLSFRETHFFLAPVGSTTILLSYIVLILGSCFYAFDSANVLQWEDVGYRAGFIAICQIPLVVLLAGKRNIIGFLTGVGYERLTWLHRWVARSLLLTVLIHMGFFVREWVMFDYFTIKIQQDPLTIKGFIAGGILLWLVVSSVAPIRNLSYEIFVVQHIISWLGFLIAVYIHVPAENHIWIWLPLGFWAFDRVVRASYIFYLNLGLLYKNGTGLIACRATFEPLDEGHTRVTIANPPITWKAGQHMFLACHVVAPLSSHPFTISSLPSDGKIEFVVRAKKGATKRFFKYAEKAYPSLPSNSSPRKVGRSVLIDGPYATIRPLRQFDSLVFLAGSTGATFTTPLMRDIVQHWKGVSAALTPFFDPPVGAVTRYIKFVWVVKRSSAVSWFASQLDQVIRDVEGIRNQGHDIAINIDIYVTSEDEISSSQSSINGDRIEASETSSEKEIALHTISLSKLNGTNLVDSQISILPGRPEVTSIIRSTAETALGEMAVVVCGPPGLVQSTRNAAVRVSDERAVHKGTGAQGIYVHAEAFGYA